MAYPSEYYVIFSAHKLNFCRQQSSTTFVVKLLFKVSEIPGKRSDLDEDVLEAATAETSRCALVEVLGSGLERRDRILAALYLI